MAFSLSALDPNIPDDGKLVDSLVCSLRGPGGVGYARSRLLEMRGQKFPLLQGIPAPLALMLAGLDGGWLDQHLLSDTGRAKSSFTRVWMQSLAKRHLALMRWAAAWPDQEVARDMLCLGWLTIIHRIFHPDPRSDGAKPDARMAWSDALAALLALAARHGLPSEQALMDRLAGPRESVAVSSTPTIGCDLERWGQHAPAVAILCASALPPEFPEQGERLWLQALAVLHRTSTGWHDGRQEPERRRILRSTINAVANRLRHASTCDAPPDPERWSQVLGPDATTDVLVQCWMVAAQPDNPAVYLASANTDSPFPPVPLEELPRQWAQAVERHALAHPSQVRRLPLLAANLSWENMPRARACAVSRTLRALALECALPAPAGATRAPSVRM